MNGDGKLTYRLSSSMPNESRSTGEKVEGKRKYFFVVEGEKTESIYLQEVMKNIKKEALIDILILERIQGSQSNQYTITLTIKEYLDINNQLSKDTNDHLLHLIYQYKEGELNESELTANLKEILGDAKESLINNESDIIGQINAVTKLNTYVKDFDKICLILDRDYGSFKEPQYEKVIEICNEYNFSLGISNPNFEFYLLLHLVDGTSLEQHKIKNNPNITNKKKYVEYELNHEMKKYTDSYRKNKYDADFLIKRFPDFKENVKKYADDNLILKNEVGTSVHHIISPLLD